MEKSFLDQLNHLRDIVSTNLLDNNILHIEETSRSPFVYINSESGKIIFKGHGIPENSNEFFKPIFDFIEKNFKNTKDIEGHFIFCYNNSSFEKELVFLYLRLSTLYKNGVNVECNWYYEKDDERMLEAGEDFISILRIPFNLVELEDLKVFLNLKFD
jgi:hypothetical protein